ncbi:MAG: hypothetical protein LBT89_00500 [Planctomycetaceae bacterium]|jgi:DNA-directed RNA polymerase subunit M/transcription elongation factor TFIIS|nr:hypothetical protein [Planctomycetaceae bacterium]
MSIKFLCPQCRYEIEASEKAAGESIFCPKCFAPMTVPEEQKTNTALQEKNPADESVYGVDAKPIDARELTDRITLSVRCSVCHTNISVTKNQIGTVIHCPECYVEMLALPAGTADKRLSVTTQEVYRVRSNTNRAATDEKLVGFHCKLCGTLMYAPEKEAGKILTCPDCNTDNTVPVRKTAAPQVNRNTEFEGAATFKTDKEAAAVSDNTGSLRKELLVPVVCHLCHTRMYALESEIGGMKVCPDCGRSTEIKFVPKAERIFPDMFNGDGYEVSEKNAAARPAMRVQTDYRYVDGSVDKAILPSKYAESSQNGTRKPDRPAVPKHPFWTRLFVPLTDGWFIIRTFLTGFLFNGGLVIYFIQPGMDAEFSAVLSFLYGIVSFLFALTFLANTSHGIVHWTAFGIDMPEKENYPLYQPTEAILYTVWLVLLVILSATPGYLTANRFSAVVPESDFMLFQFLFMTVSLFIVFPVFFLSSMQSNSFFEILTKGVLTSFFRSAGLWLRYYFAVFLFVFIFFATDVWLSSSIGDPVVVFALNGFLCPVAVAVYFRLLGRMALALENRR